MNIKNNTIKYNDSDKYSLIEIVQLNQEYINQLQNQNKLLDEINYQLELLIKEHDNNNRYNNNKCFNNND